MHGEIKKMFRYDFKLYCKQTSWNFITKFIINPLIKSGQHRPLNFLFKFKILMEITETSLNIFMKSFNHGTKSYPSRNSAEHNQISEQ